jgi:hypothetical protein
MSNRGLIHSSTLQELFGRHHYLVNRYRTSVSQIIMPVMDIYFVFRNHNPGLSSFMTYHTVCNKSSMMVPIMEQKLITLSEHPSSSPVCVAQSLVFCVVFCRSLFFPFALFTFGHCVVCSSFGHCGVCSSVFWPLWCLFFYIRILISPLVSSNHSCKLHGVVGTSPASVSLRSKDNKSGISYFSTTQTKLMSKIKDRLAQS